MKVRIATRKSKLAQMQTDTVGNLLKNKFSIEYEKVLIVTKGDKILNVTLDKIGGKGLFVKDIETAMLKEEADAAVHSMKDVPYELPEGFELVAIPEREDVRDVLVSSTGCTFDLLPKGAKIGTSSIRRARQLEEKRPDLTIVPIRGNIQTRLRKMKEEKMDGIILAAAGLKRMGMESYITSYFDPMDFVPAVGQGALGIEMPSDHQYNKHFQQLNISDARICVDAERSFMRRLNGDCHTTIGAYAQIHGNQMHIIGLFDVHGRLVKKEISGNKEDYLQLGKSLAEKILKG